MGVVAADVAQSAGAGHSRTVQREGLRYGDVRACAVRIPVELQGGARIDQGAVREGSQRAAVLDAQFALGNGGQAAVDVGLRESGPAVADLHQRERAAALT